MRVVLLRHGPAGKQDPERWPDDAERPLSARGIGRTRMATSGLARLERGIGLILTSPLKRARETAEMLAEAREGEARLEVLDALSPGNSYRSVVDRLRELDADQTVALVGHEPDLGKLAGVLLLGAPAALPLKKAGACVVGFPQQVEAGAGRLEWFLPPRVLRRYARSRKART